MAASRSLEASLSASLSASVWPFSLEAPAFEGPFLAAGFAFCCLEGLAVGFDFGCFAAGFRSSSSSEALPSHSSSPSSLEESMVRFAFGMVLSVGEESAEREPDVRAQQPLGARTTLVCQRRPAATFRCVRSFVPDLSSLRTKFDSNRQVAWPRRRCG